MGLDSQKLQDRLAARASVVAQLEGRNGGPQTGVLEKLNVSD